MFHGCGEIAADGGFDIMDLTSILILTSQSFEPWASINGRPCPWVHPNIICVYAVTDGSGADPSEYVRPALFLPQAHVFFPHFAEVGIKTAMAAPFTDEVLQGPIITTRGQRPFAAS
jgi:hypothetical protein